MKLKSLTWNICQELIETGYSHFVVKSNIENITLDDMPQLVTYIPVKGHHLDSEPIAHVRERIGKVDDKYFVMMRE